MGIFFRRVLHHPVTAWVVLLASLVLTALAWRISETFVHQRANDRFQFEVADITLAIERRIRDYEMVLRGGLGLFAVTDAVTRECWQKYVSSLSIDTYFPGIQGIGFSKVIPPAELADHIAKIRSEGFPSYSVRPDGKRELYTSIIYLEPFSGRNLRAFGYDMFSEPVRRAAMERARDTGKMAISGGVTLVQEDETDIQRGFLMYLPVYRKGSPSGTAEERRAALSGFVYSPFRIKDFMLGILGSGVEGISFEVFEGNKVSADTILYDSNDDGRVHADTPGHRPDFSSKAEFSVGGHIWTLYIHSTPGFFSPLEASQPLLVAGGGVFVDFLLFVIIASVTQRQKQALFLAAEMTEALRQSKRLLSEKARMLELANASLEQFTHVLAHHLQEPVRLQYAFTQHLDKLLPEPHSPEAKQALNYVLHGARHLHDLLRDVEIYLSAHRLSPPGVPCDADAALDAALLQAGEAIVETGAVIERHPLPHVWIGALQLTDVFSALLSNALRFRHPDRPLCLSISAACDGEHAVLSVCDNGIGINPQYHERVFGIFEQLQRDRDSSSTGLGLSLAKRIVESAGGRIWIESGLLNGICVRIALRPEQGGSTA